MRAKMQTRMLVILIAVAMVALLGITTGCRTAEQNRSVINAFGGGGTGNPAQPAPSAVVWTDDSGAEHRGVATGATDAEGRMLVLNAAGGVSAVDPASAVILPGGGGGGVTVNIFNTGTDSNQGKTIPVDVGRGATVDGVPLP